jgi:6-phosphogluconate dehydrogenase (decarboxylating)
VADIAEVWRRGSVVSSWLLDLTADALATDPKLDGYSGSVADSGEGRWTIEAAMEQSVPVPVLSNSLFARFRSRQQSTYGDKLLSAMRFGFRRPCGDFLKNDGHRQETQGRSPLHPLPCSCSAPMATWSSAC